MAMMHRLSARNLIMRFLDDLFLRSLIIIFSHCWVKLSASASITILLSSEPRNYLPQLIMLKAISFIFVILLVLFVTPRKVGLHHFCVALMITHKFRLCLHPHGSSVSSRYTFSNKAWLGVFCTNIIPCFTKFLIVQIQCRIVIRLADRGRTIDIPPANFALVTLTSSHQVNAGSYLFRSILLGWWTSHWTICGHSWFQPVR